MANALMEALSSGAQNELANKLRSRGFKYRDAQESGLPSKNELYDVVPEFYAQRLYAGTQQLAQSLVSPFF